MISANFSSNFPFNMRGVTFPPSPPPPKHSQGSLEKETLHWQEARSSTRELEAEGQTVVQFCMTQFPIEFSLGNM